MGRKYLFLLAALIWGIPGVSITLKGIGAYRSVASGQVLWLLLVTAAVSVSFYFMFRRIVGRYSERIYSLPSRVTPLQTFPMRGWLLLFVMMGLGILLKHIPSVPNQFVASFYTGLGPMLILSAVRFLRNGFRGNL
ncbi:MAG: hypothetical protein IJX65_07420 [Alistipes sp.]|nr:hypothetical protein [Alistipes sp.]